jgi:mono/diheme cytochrome c family protein
MNEVNQGGERFIRCRNQFRHRAVSSRVSKGFSTNTLLLAAFVTGGSVVPLAAATGEVTFTKHIAPILFQNCAECHRPGEVAPFPLLRYEDARKRAKTIVKVTEKRFMPPWKAEHGYGDFLNERRLTDEQIALIRRWADAGAPEGNPADLPPAPVFPTGWTLGEPDLVLGPTEPYRLPAEGRDDYRNFVIPTNFEEDRWVSALQVQPGNRSVVHHVIAFVDTSGRARKLDEAAPGPGYSTFGGTGVPGSEWLDAWVPGKTVRHLPAGFGKLVPKGADIILQVHYNKTGKPEQDLTTFGLYFCREPVDKRVRVSRLAFLPLRIPAGDSNHTVRASMPIPADVTVLEVAPHMHLLGREMKVEATLPDGRKAPMVNVTDWDFNWQLSYVFREPLKLPARSQVELVARYDNSAANPFNPSSPPKPVRWGEQTEDEMCIAFFSYTVDQEHLTRGVASNARLGLRNSNVGREEMLRQIAEQVDTNKDGKIDDAERKAALEAFQRERKRK